MPRASRLVARQPGAFPGQPCVNGHRFGGLSVVGREPGVYPGACTFLTFVYLSGGPYYSLPPLTRV